MLALIFAILHHLVMVVEVLAVTAMVLIGVDVAIYEYRDHKETARLNVKRILEATKESLRLQKEEQARRQSEETGAFFEEAFLPGFDGSGNLHYRGHTVSADARWSYYEKLDKLADTQIFLSTEVL